jgi:hypothetical protein
MVRAFDEATRKRAAVMARRVECIMYEGVVKERRDDGWVGTIRVGREIASKVAQDSHARQKGDSRP